MPSPFFYEKQNTTLVWVACIIVFVIIAVLGFYGEDITNDEGDKMPAIFVYINLTIILAAFLLFYNMKIVLDDKYLLVKFGIGVFKKSLKLKILINQLLTFTNHQ